MTSITQERYMRAFGSPGGKCELDRGSNAERRPTAGQAQRTPIGRLREIARRCSAGKPLNGEQSMWLGAALATFLKQEAESLEQALGLCYGRGGVPWWREEANRERDAALRGMAEDFFAADKTCVRSREIATIARRYAASAWRVDRDRQEMPGYYAGTPREYLWRAFRSGASMPLGERQVRNIIR